MSITGPGDHFIAPERRCDLCGDLLGLNDISPCWRCTPVATVTRQRGATKATLAYRAKMFGVVDGGTTRGEFFSAVLKVLP